MYPRYRPGDRTHGDRRRGSSAAPHRGSRPVQRVATCPVVRVHSEQAERELVHVRLPDDDRAGSPQVPDDRRGGPDPSASSRTRLPAVVRSPSITTVSLTAIGMPTRSRARSPAPASSSTSRRARSARTEMNALTSSWVARQTSIAASTTSDGERSPRARELARTSIEAGTATPSRGVDGTLQSRA